MIDYTINGLVTGNIYALLAVGLALIFGVSNLINFAHGSVYTLGAYIGWFALTHLGWPLYEVFPLVMVSGALAGIAIERLAIGPLAGRGSTGPLLMTIGISIVLDQLVQLVFGSEPRALPSGLPAWTLRVGGGTIGALDLLIAAVGICSTALLYFFLRFSRAGWAVRATAQDREAAQQMGVNTERVNLMVFAIAGALGGLSGLLVGMYYNNISPAMSLNATLKGIIAILVGGATNLPGALAGGLLLGLLESYCVALFGTPARDLFAYAVLLIMLLWRPNGLFSRRRMPAPEVLTGSFVGHSRAVPLPRIILPAAAALALVVPFLGASPYLLQVLTNAWLAALIAISLTLIAGTVGMISLGQAGLVAIGAYASALLALDGGLSVWISIPFGAVVASVLAMLFLAPTFRLRSHYFSIGTLGVGEMIGLLILNGGNLTRGAMGVVAVPPLAFLKWDLSGARAVYWSTLTLLLLAAWVLARLQRSSLGRIWRAIREDEVAARSYGISLTRYKALAFGVAGLVAGLSGALSAHVYSYINYETFTSQISILALTMVILGGLGNIAGAIFGAVLLVVLPEVSRSAQSFRMLLYGLVLLLLTRFRPQGLLGRQ